MTRYAGFEFKCQCCGGVFYRLTEKFRPEPPMRGDYVELLPKYGPQGHNWYDFPHTPWTIGDNVACVQCGEPIRAEYVNALFERSEEAKASGPAQGQVAGEDQAGNGPAQAETGSSSAGAVSGVDSGVDAGLYDAVDIEDKLLAEVLRMTAAGETQTVIAETCGISVYRVRKLQNGELK